MNNYRSDAVPIREDALDTGYAHVTIKEADTFNNVYTGLKDNKISFKQDEYQSETIIKPENETL